MSNLIILWINRMFKLQDKLIDINGIKLHEDEQFYHLLQRINEDLEVNVMRNVVKNDNTVIMAGTSPSVTTTIYTHWVYIAIKDRPDEQFNNFMDKSHAQDRNQFFKLFEDATTGKRNWRNNFYHIENSGKIIKRCARYDYIIVNVRYDSSAGRSFGLNIANVTAHKIIILEVAENTVARDYLKIYDHIIALNGNSISDVTAVIKRPVTLDSNGEIKREFKQRELKQTTSLVSVLRKPTGQQRKIHFSEHHNETQIQSDTPATKRLRQCR
ncbi:unnamed protein product [Brugia pahangi]|uniref:PDZ domain-containing protein n=1 Tax=Brugia pahangi TaxID=6280 RepID=A0A0N4U056_BRUPA|nr:unnamed protein product [Brugia pahangi]